MASVTLGALATDLANVAASKAAGRLAEAAFGPAQERELKALLGESIRALLDGLTRSGELAEDPDYVSGLRTKLSNFFSSEEVAYALVSVAVDSEPLPVGRLREIYEGRGYDPGAFPVTFERAMETCALHLARRIREEASAPEHPLHNFVEISKLYGLEGMVSETLRRTEPSGPKADELERASWTRCRRRWTTLGVAPDEAEILARNPAVGAPGPDVREQLGRPVNVIAAEAGSGKSLLLDRLMQRAIVRYRDEEYAPLPVFIDVARVRGELREAVVHGTRSLGRPEEVGAAVFLDGLEEAGRSEAGRLLEEAHYLPDVWPSTTVVVAGRPLQELEEEKEHGDPIELPELTAAETASLIRRFSGDDRVLDALLHGLPESVRKAVRRPLFATLVGLNMRNNYGRDARSVGELLSHLVERALKKSGEAVELKELRDLAVAVTDSASGRVRAGDVGTWTQVGRMRATGLVHEVDGTLRFSLQILSEWFAAQALELGEVDAEELASDFGRLERWRYPLVMAVSNFGYERVSRIFGPLVRAAPAFASQVADAAFDRYGSAEGGPADDAAVVTARLREAMGAWVEGLGPLAPLFAPIREDGSLGTLAITGSIWEPGMGKYAWYAGEVDLPDVVPYSRVVDSELKYGIPQRTYVVGRQASWPWGRTFKDLRGDLEKALKKRTLPAVTPMLAREAAWRTAKDLLHKEKRRSRYSDEPIALEEIETLFDECGVWDGGWIWRPPPRTSLRPVIYGASHLVEEVRRLRDSGESEMASPAPIEDRTLDEARRAMGNDDTMYTWDWYSEGRLLERARILVQETLHAYAKVAETLVPALRPHMPMAATLPGRIVGYLDVRSDTERREPLVSWYVEPLPPGYRNTSEISLETRPEAARPGLWEEYDARASYLRPKIAALRPQAAGWLAPVTEQLHSGQLFDSTPVTKTCRHLLWDDLRYAKWVTSMNPWTI
ncbi:hypothetical protein GBA63_19840 [Rubrobacter tropicus]|uniref:Uncharacterized protein n=1 Tax=Rubrobacter tropicus TaxID=2653851 RepID=A0A6G8QE22_9ACTN|nr:hypothetical protein [Rubrobacter tropicus]QIN84651.1 hypothetical protein GBA63_19840 [Rubrobacter tropicus]